MRLRTVSVTHGGGGVPPLPILKVLLSLGRVSVWRALLLTSALFCPAAGGAQAPGSPSQAQVFEQQGKVAEAIGIWQAIIARNPSDAGAFASLGVDLSRQHAYPEAAAAYRKALRLDPRLPGIELNLGLAEFKQGHFTAAIAPLRAALQSDPSSLQARTLLGLSYYGAKRFADAIEPLRAASAADPSNLELLRVLAQSCVWAKNSSCSLEIFQKILEHDPNSSAAHVLMGEAFDGLGKTSEAAAEFEAAVNAAPREPNLHFGLGYLHWKLKQYDAAETDFKNELALNPAHAQALAYLGDVAFKKDDSAAALPLLQKALQSRHDLRIAYVDLGAILAQQGKHQEALALLKRAVALDPQQPDAHFRLGRVYEAFGQRAAAETEFAKVRELHDKAEEDVARKMSATPPPLPKPPEPPRHR